VRQEDTAAYHDDISSSRVLGKLLEASGLRRPPGYEAHHIVAGNSKYEAADEGRKILRNFGIRINDPENGVWLPASKKSPNPDGLAVHRPLHSYEYMDAVTEALKMATTKQQAIDILQSIGRALQSGGYP
jgi:A nuclease family of the HNH/ENDO VII superfamily with conserved AHH